MPFDSLLTLMKEKNIDILPDWSGTITRDKNQWFVGHNIFVNGKSMYRASFGDWSQSEKGFSWQSDGVELTAEELAEIKTKFRRIDREAKVNKIAQQEQVTKELEKLWSELENSPAMSTHKYLEKKNVSHSYNAKESNGILYIPLRDNTGKIYSLQKIDSLGNKTFHAGGSVRGNFHILQGDIIASNIIYISEGFATSASVAEAMPEATVVCAFFAGNLKAVTENIRAVSPSPIVIAADNDEWKERNAGVIAAQQCLTISNVAVRVPKFPRPQPGNSDWNDLATAESVTLVREQLLAAPTIALAPVSTTALKTPKFLQSQITKKLFEMHGNRIAKREGNYFEYKETHWVEVTKDGFDFIRQDIDQLTGKTLDAAKIDGHLAHYLFNVPVVPAHINLFTPNPYRANFQDGTIHLIPEGKGHRIERHDHDMFDYCTNVLPFKVPVGPGETPQFDSLLMKLFSNDQDKEAKIRLFKQVMGGCLVSLFPRWIHFDGHSGSGKSTLLKLLTKLVHERDIVVTSMHGIENFMLFEILGKSVLMDNDIDTKRALKSDVIKKAIDRIPFKADRKYRDAAQGMFPAMIVTAGNGLPVTSDGDSKAFYRRMTIVKVDSWTATDEDLGFSDRLWTDEKTGIVWVAYAGLLDLLENGWVKLASSRELIGEMQDRGDIIQQFVDAVKDKEVFISGSTLLQCGENMKIKRTELWKIFDLWQISIDQSRKTYCPCSQFYKGISTHFKPIKFHGGIRCYLGLGASVDAAGQI